MNRIAIELKNNDIVKRYIELRKIILSNDEYIKLSKTDLSLSEAKIDNFPLIEMIYEYQELEKLVKNDLSMISNIINEAININFW
ncbi:MAG: hypothetical protein K6E24_05550 [bacterium]|nr:hypothetical protein [bacterium]